MRDRDQWHREVLGQEGFESENESIYDGRIEPPDGVFSAIATGSTHSCGLRPDGTVQCWGNNWRGQTNAPDGKFTVTAPGAEHTCGIRADGTIQCWDWITNLPEDVRWIF